MNLPIFIYIVIVIILLAFAFRYTYKPVPEVKDLVKSLFFQIGAIIFMFLLSQEIDARREKQMREYIFNYLESYIEDEERD